jgi:hypothetical protein
LRDREIRRFQSRVSEMVVASKAKVAPRDRLIFERLAILDVMYHALRYGPTVTRFHIDLIIRRAARYVRLRK